MLMIIEEQLLRKIAGGSESVLDAEMRCIFQTQQESKAPMEPSPCNAWQSRSVLRPGAVRQGIHDAGVAVVALIDVIGVELPDRSAPEAAPRVS